MLAWALLALLFLSSEKEPVPAWLVQDAAAFIADAEDPHGLCVLCEAFHPSPFCAAVKADNSSSLPRNVLRSVG